MTDDTMDDSENPMPAPAAALAQTEEIALRSLGQSLELHHRLNEATVIQRVLEQPGITSLDTAKAAVQERLNALMVLDRQLRASADSADAAPAVVEHKPWH